jgi:flagellar hook protein FlgE
MEIEPIEDNFTTSNVLFTQMVAPLKGLVEPSQTRLSSSVSIPSHATSINLYDSLGGRHALRVEFQKVSTSEWTWKASVPEPGSLVGGVAPDENILRGGTVTFTRNGALRSYTPPNIIFNANKGARNGQVVQMDFGSLDGFDGLTHLDKTSYTEGIKQDGFTGGSLVGTRIDETGTIIGNFSNDRAFALAKISMASFVNNIGLSASSNNLFAETANSGKPIIGVAGSGGRGSMEASRLEASNVDLTKSLTQLIVVQRGFQANSKTITTSDQMLNTLLQMKQ